LTASLRGQVRQLCG